MKNLRTMIAFMLILAMGIGLFAFASDPVNAADEIGFQSGSNLRIVQSQDRQVLLGLPEKKTFHDLLSMIYSYNTVKGIRDGKYMSDGDMISTGTVLMCGNTQLHTVIRGDASGDGAVDVSDLLRIKKYFLGEFHLDDLYLMAADLSGDNLVDSTDYLHLKQHFLKNMDIYDEGAVVVPTQMDVVLNSRSSYTIAYSTEAEMVAAYALRDVIAERTGATLAVKDRNRTTIVSKLINMRCIQPRNVGNYGYAITGEGTCLNIYASALAGFDNAIDQLMSDCVAGKNLRIPAGYASSDQQNWETNYIPSGGGYHSTYRDGTFYNDKNDSVAYVSNAMWHMFGRVDDGQNIVYRFGNEPTWFEWMSEKLAWSTDQQYINELKEKLRTFPQTSTGYMWSWSTYPYWKVDECYSIHYDGTFRYIAAVYDIISWEGNTQFLYQSDTDTAGGNYANVDSSQGRTVLAKTEACMDYILNYLNGNTGSIRLTQESTYLNASGSQRFDYVKELNAYCWNNTGKDGSTASNYWDNLCFGNEDGYSSALLYNALNSMAGIYRMLGGNYIAKAQSLENLAVTVKSEFNQKFWSQNTGRYIACIDTNGRRVDYGLTFHNFEIMKYGLADPIKAKSIFDWVDGDRIVAGEDRTGADIMSYAKIMEQVPGNVSQQIGALNLRLAAVSNTISINNPQNQSSRVAWWHAPSGIDVWSSAAYGRHLENGGYIFYPVFYELMARTEYEGAQSTTDRLYEIGRVYEYNRLVSDASALHSTNWLEGLNGEFPENGLVPTTYLYSLMGVSAAHDGLHVAPKFNEVYEYMGVKDLSYGGNVYKLQVNRDASCTITPRYGTLRMDLHYTPDKFHTATYRITIYSNDGMVLSRTVTPDASGTLHIQLNETGVDYLTIAPQLK